MYNDHCIIDLFSGAGGFSLGFEQAGFHTVVANEFSPIYAKTFKANHPNVEMLIGDIAEIKKEDIEKALNKKGKTLKDDYILIGGPPCQSYSTSGKRQMDARANLFLEYKRILSVVKPIVFVFENVTGILSMDSGKLFKRVCNELEGVGYTIHYEKLNASHYGVPQTRERVFIIGIRKDIYNAAYSFPEPFDEYVNNPVPLSEAFADLPNLQCGESRNEYTKNKSRYSSLMRGEETILALHKAPSANEKTKEIMRVLKEGESKKDLPERLQTKGGFNNSYGKLWWNKPSGTVTRNFSCISSTRCIHPIDNRALTIREGTRLQSFPDSYKFCGNAEDIRIQIGNAVPPMLAKVIAESIKEYLNKNATL